MMTDETASENGTTRGNASGKISDRPLKFFFLFLGLWIGGAITKLVIVKFIRPSQFTDPNSAGQTAWIIVAMIVVVSAWAHSIIGRMIAYRLNSSTMNKTVRTIAAWSISLFALVFYLFLAGFFYNTAKLAESLNQHELAGSGSQRMQSAAPIDISSTSSQQQQSEANAAQQYIDNQDWQGLKQLALKYSEQYPGALPGWQYLTLANYKMGYYGDAIKAADHALSIDAISKDSAWTYNLRGLCYSGSGDKQKAVDDVMAAIQRDPSQSGELYYNLAHIQMSMDGAFDQSMGKAKLVLACNHGFQQACDEAQVFRAVLNNKP